MIPTRKQAEADFAAAREAHLAAMMERDALLQRHLNEMDPVLRRIAETDSARYRARAVAAIATINADALASLRADTPTGPGSRSLILAGLAVRREATGMWSTYKKPAEWTELGKLARVVLAELETK